MPRCSRSDRLLFFNRNMRRRKAQILARKKKFFREVISLEHNYFSSLEGPKPSSCTVSHDHTYFSSLEEQEQSQEKSYPSIQIIDDNDRSHLEEIIVDWMPESLSDQEELNCNNEYIHSDSSFIAEEEYFRINEPELEIERCLPKEPLSKGHRIVDLNYVLNWSMKIQKEHLAYCPLGEMKVIDEQQIGFTSVIKFQCSQCGACEEHATEDTKSVNSRIDYGAVWGTLSTGNTFSRLKELLTILHIPCRSNQFFQKIKMETNNFYMSMEQAGREEREQT